MHLDQHAGGNVQSMYSQAYVHIRSYNMLSPKITAAHMGLMMCEKMSPGLYLYSASHPHLQAYAWGHYSCRYNRIVSCSLFIFQFRMEIWFKVLLSPRSVQFCILLVRVFQLKLLEYHHTI